MVQLLKKIIVILENHSLRYLMYNEEIKRSTFIKFLTDHQMAALTHVKSSFASYKVNRKENNQELLNVFQTSGSVCGINAR